MTNPSQLLTSLRRYSDPRWIWRKRVKITNFLIYRGREPFRQLSIHVDQPFTRNDQQLRQYRNKHQGERCFIIGNGPSLEIRHLDRLHQNREVTFASNKIFLAFEQTQWRPTYYSAEDYNIVIPYKETLEAFPKSTIVFLPDYLDYLTPRLKAALYYHMIWHIPRVKEFDYPNPPEFSPNALLGIYSGCTVSYILIQLAWFMGFREIYLLGMDFNYTVPRNATQEKPGSFITTGQENNHFIKNYLQPGDHWSVPRVPMMLKAMEAAANYAQSHGGKIYDLSLTGKLTCFPKKQLESLF